MPELPEVETIKRSLESEIVGDTVNKTCVYYEGMLQDISKTKFIQRTLGKFITAVERIGKYLLIYLSDSIDDGDSTNVGSQQVVIIHLRMTGRIILSANDENPINSANDDYYKHLRAMFYLNSGKKIEFHDQRKFGTMAIVEAGYEHNWKGLGKLGPEPISCDFSQEEFSAKLTRTKKSIKACLLDQQIIAGVGNIYADEALFRSKIHPAKTANELTDLEIANLYKNLCHVLELGIEYRGTTFSDYRDSYGNIGGFQDLLQVYNRRGENCHHCGEKIEKGKVANRGTYYCPGCQENDACVK